MPAILSAKNVIYMKKLRYPSVEIEEGSATFICGASGSGKSTLLRLFNGSISPDEGEIFYGGKNILAYEPVKLRREVLLASQEVFLFDKTIAENFAEFYSYRGEKPPEEEKIKELLELCRVPFEPGASCVNMSGGEKQRVYLALCLSFSPRVLMLDEPTSALDAATGKVVIGGIKNYCKERGITLVAVSHDADLTDFAADSVINLERRDT